LQEENEKFIVLKISRICPLVLFVKVGPRSGRELSEEVSSLIMQHRKEGENWIEF
jgi:hypothetical protein